MSSFFGVVAVFVSACCSSLSHFSASVTGGFARRARIVMSFFCVAAVCLSYFEVRCVFTFLRCPVSLPFLSCFFSLWREEVVSPVDV